MVPADFIWAPLVPELLVTSLPPSLRFWCGLVGFSVAYDRPEEGFAYLHLDGAQVMLEEAFRPGRRWITAPLERPFGRGMNLQVVVPDFGAALARLRGADWPLFMEPEEKWYRAGTQECGVRQLLVQDPDGYLVRLQKPLGLRPSG